MIFVSYNYKDMFILYQEMNIFNAHLNTVLSPGRKERRMIFIDLQLTFI